MDYPQVKSKNKKDLELIHDHSADALDSPVKRATVHTLNHSDAHITDPQLLEVKGYSSQHGLSVLLNSTITAVTFLDVALFHCIIVFLIRLLQCLRLSVVTQLLELGKMSTSTSSKLVLPMYIVDAFTNVPFYGNPAAVCLISPGKTLTDSEKQKIAAEMNLSETAFISLSEGDFLTADTFGLRWFTPATEVDLCGHATLAAASVLFREIGNSNDAITFTSRSGPLVVTQQCQNKISLDFPGNPADHVDAEDFKKLIEAAVGDLLLVQDIQFNSKTGKLLVRLKDNVHRETLEKLRVLPEKLLESDTTGKVRGVGVTLKGSQDNGCVDNEGQVYDFVSRYFAPWLGIPEDPVTGAWHTVSSLYWAKELHKSKLYARQCSRRGGDLWLTVQDGGQRVTLTGQSVINLRGNLYL